MALRGLPLFGGQLQGTTTNDNAATGNIGEFVTAILASGSAIGLTTATPANVTSITLSPGDWDVWGNVVFTPASTTVLSGDLVGASSVSATFGSVSNAAAQDLYPASFAPNGNISRLIPPVRFSLSVSTTIFLVAQANFSTSTCTAFGSISARRRR